MNYQSKSFFDNIKDIITSFNLVEKVLFWILFVVLLSSFFFVANRWFKVSVPTFGGSIVEGVIGAPTTINPIIATSNTGQDLTYLTHSGLLKYGSSGLEYDLAENIEVSEDGLIYTITLKDTIIFQDGNNITSDDVLYTIQQIQNPNIKSPKQINWTGVATEKIDGQTFQLILPNPLSTFIQNLTVGIIPKHIWQNISDADFAFDKHNTYPVGSGQYQIKQVIKDGEEKIKTIVLEAFDNHSNSKPYLKKISFNIYKDQAELLNAYKTKQVDSFYLNNLIENTPNITPIKFTTPQIIATFFKQNEDNIFSKEIREALRESINKSVISQQLQNSISIIDNPIPEYFLAHQTIITVSDIEEIQTRLEANGWQKNSEGIYELTKDRITKKFSFNLSTLDTPQYIAVAEILQRQWQNLGAEVELRTYNSGDLATIITQRDYDVLLYGITINSVDIRAYWHSTQRNIGYNLSDYTNIQVDNLINKIRQSVNYDLSFDQYADSLQEIANLIQADVPAVFLYSPNLYYYPSAKLQNTINPHKIINIYERFNDINNWYILTDQVYPLFQK